MFIVQYRYFPWTWEVDIVAIRESNPELYIESLVLCRWATTSPNIGNTYKFSVKAQ